MRRSSIEMSPLVSVTNPTAGHHIDFIQKRLTLPESREPMVLHPYQTDLIEGWADGDVLADATVIGAGNAKTTTLGAFLTSHLFQTVESSVPVVADTVTQAVLTAWGRVKRFIELNPDLECRAEILEGQGSRRGIYVPSTNGHCFPIADRPGGLVGLIPSIAVVEEIAEASVATFSTLMNRLGKRSEGKLIGIGHPSFLPENALLHIQRAHHSGEPIPKVVLREHISQQKDHRDESGWHDANPALAAGILDISAIRVDLMLPEQRFRAVRLCQNPKGSESCWLNSTDDAGEETGDAFDIWQRAESGYAFNDDAPTWIGADVAKSRDHAAVVWCQFRPDGRLHAKSKVWTPTADADIDLDDIGEWLVHLAGRYDVQEISYDPSYFYNAPQLAKDGLPMVAVPPSEARMAPLVGHAYQAIRRTRITHDGDEQFTSHVLAGKRRYCASGFTIEKRDYAIKCDAAIALVLAHGAATDLDPGPDYTDDSFVVH